jgi:hypothetical protein
MNDVARPAGAGKPQMNEIERCGMIDSLQCSREEPTQYEAPESGDKMRALYVIALMDLSNGAKAVAAALVWHATVAQDAVIQGFSASPMKRTGAARPSSTPYTN